MTKADAMDYFKTAPVHEVKIALNRIRQIPDEQTVRELKMSPVVFKAVSNQMLAKFAAHRGDKPGGPACTSPRSRARGLPGAICVRPTNDFLRSLAADCRRQSQRDVAGTNPF